MGTFVQTGTVRHCIAYLFRGTESVFTPVHGLYQMLLFKWHVLAYVLTERLEAEREPDLTRLDCRIT